MGQNPAWIADAPALQAIAASQLGGLPEPLLGDLFADSTRGRVPAGTLTHREGDSDPHLELMVSGLLKFYATAPDGRTITVRYCRRGSLMGVVSLFSPDFALPVSAVALTDTELVRLSPVRVRGAAARELTVAHVFLRELSERVLDFLAGIPGSAFTSVRQRVARHLLDLADGAGQLALTEPWPGAGPELSVRITQQELAQEVGSVREVVVRILRELREAGVVRTERDRIVVVEPGRLAELAIWNPSS
ncbi:Crp/Fnr family transcriptional regulator [Arthrobacter sulfonylureivorans]|uniref:Crp/Fnr family transcriptional regulator n=1 Tax=Arthrobacter sulfonylureivorans TaxID=2486855 RepID=A0ABY3W950_9MICC|nr:Crp/Fnr family transcriptional regulator [Arthrobacter sulfonylureivorans]UNK46873.1 Crp/Fnr family transcriptional regulator [Arthrobacter sulfonylureivorans]